MEAFKKRDKGNEGANEAREWELSVLRVGGTFDVAHENGKLKTLHFT